MASEITPSSSDSEGADKSAVRRSPRGTRSSRWLLIMVMLASAVLSFLSFRDLDVASVPRLFLFASSTAIAAVSAARGLKGDVWTIVPGAAVALFVIVVSSLLYLWLFVW